jgi:uncharacterized protein (DUF362 family)
MVHVNFAGKIAAFLMVCAMGLVNAQTINVPPRNVPSPATVAVIKSNVANPDQAKIKDMVSQAINSSLPLGINSLVHSGDRVLIKVNSVANVQYATTDWHVVKALVDLIKAAYSNTYVIVADGGPKSNSVDLMSSCGFNGTNIPNVNLFADLNHVPYSTYQLSEGFTGFPKQISQEITNANVYISMPKLKTHYHCGITGALKNIGVGIAPYDIWKSAASYPDAKGSLHHDIRREIVDHILCRVPNFTLMDAIWTMEGDGPASGKGLEKDLILASTDPVAVDAVACKIMGIPSYLISHQVLAADANIGTNDLNKITVVGTSISDAYNNRNFTLALASSAGPMDGAESKGIIPYRATTVVRPAPAQMVIDGNLNKWNYANTLTADTVLQVKVPTGNTYGGRADGSFMARLMYDQLNLYLAVTVRDDNMQLNTYSDANIIKGECIELYFSTYLNQFDTTDHTTYTSNSIYDYHLAISTNNPYQAYMLSHNKTLTGFDVKKIPVNDGYVMEMKIPFTNFGIPAGSALPKDCGFNIAVDDYDANPAVYNKIMWSNATNSKVETAPFKMGLAYLDPVTRNYDNQNPALTSIRVTPSDIAISPSATQKFTATGIDQYGWPFQPQPTITWTVNGGGTINPTTGIFTAGTIEGNFLVTAQGNGVTGTASFTVGQTGTEKIINGKLDNALANWVKHIEGNIGTIDGINGTALFTLTAPGANDYSMQLNQTVNYKKGRTYTLTFDASSPEGGRPLVVKQDQDGGDYHAIGGSANQTYQLTTQPQRFPPYTFVCTEDNAAGRLSFNVGGNAYDVIIDNVSLIESAPGNQAPIAKAGSDQAAMVNAQVTLDGSASSDPEGSAITYFWTQISGPSTIILSSQTVAKPSFTTAVIGTYEFNLKVSDGSKDASDNVVITVSETVINLLKNGDFSQGNAFWVSQYTAPANGTFNFPTTCQVLITAAGTDPYHCQVYQLLNVELGKKYQCSFSGRTLNINDTRTINFVVEKDVANWDKFCNKATVLTGTKQTFTGADYTFTPTATPVRIEIQAGLNKTQFEVDDFVVAPFIDNTPPTITTAAGAVPNPVAGLFTDLSVTANDDKGEPGLVYTWSSTNPAVQFVPNGTNAARISRATFSSAGAFPIQVLVRDQGGLTATSVVSGGVAVNQTLTAITVSPANPQVYFSQTQQFSATGMDQFNKALTTQPAFTWTVSGGGTINQNGLFTAGTDAGAWTVTASYNGISGSTQVTVRAPNYPPTIISGATASPNPVVGTTSNLSVTATDDAGDQNMVYTWSCPNNPAVQFSPNGNNAANHCVATFPNAGSYSIQVEVKDLGGLTVTSVVAGGVMVNQTVASIIVTPVNPSVYFSQTQQFTATARDQFGNLLTTQPAIAWEVTGGGTINQNGLFTAGTVAGTWVVTASYNGIWGSTQVTVRAPNSAPAIITPASATPNQVAGTFSDLSVTATDDGGDQYLIYTWSSTNPFVSFAPNGTTAARISRATFTSAGTFPIQVEVRDQAGLTVTSVVSGGVVVNQTVNSINVTFASITLLPLGTQQFSATAKDQFGATMTTTYTWSVSHGNPSSGGSVNPITGFYTAGTTGGTDNVIAQSGIITGTAVVQTGTEKIINGNFNTVLAPWIGYVLTAGTGSVTQVTINGDGVARITINAAGGVDYAFQLNQQINFITGKTYTLKFDAYSPEAARNLVIKIDQNGGDYHSIKGWTTQSRPLTTSRQTFSFPSFVCQENNANGRISFNAGLNVNDVIIDNVSLIEQ